ncbi:FAD binding domain protein [Xylariaceae sp. FL0594]|nr:FAD binding domain protein [Xylariaceae sp. FL0594]
MSARLVSITALVALLGVQIASATAAHDSDRKICKTIPGDPEWPSVADWNAFNATIGGKLVTPYELGRVCHNPDYDEAACNRIREQWVQPHLHQASSSSIMAAAVANESCDPFTSRELTCLPGLSVTYSVNATDATDFAKTIAFAHSRNIRLVIRNTGHDYLGKSTGPHSLSIWTHHLKNTSYIQYKSSYYKGPAIRLGAGIQVEEAYVAARAYSSLVVGGDCDTVGVTGGYLQGGGHSALSSLYGLGADHVLEWEVVDGTGRLLRATPQENQDLYWALSGGGGGTYGVVVSVVVKLHPDTRMTGVQLQFNLDPKRPDIFHKAVSQYHDLVPSITAAKGMGIASVSNTTFSLTPLTFPNASSSDVKRLMAPLMRDLDSNRVTYDVNITEYPHWLDYWRSLIKPNPTQLVQNAQYGGWMIPRSVLESHPGALQSAIRKITDAGCVFVGLALNVSRTEDAVPNAVHPAWRDAALNVILSTGWPEGAKLDAMDDLAKTMTRTCVPALSKLAPKSGAYLNEADPNQPNWKEAFYGANYDRLLAVKNKYDPQHLFYATTAVGSDYYTVDEAGRLCTRHGH